MGNDGLELRMANRNTINSQQMGSRVYARRARGRGDNIVAMLSLETIDYYDDAEGSQHYPLPLYSLFYLDTGNDIAFIGNLSSELKCHTTAAT